MDYRARLTVKRRGEKWHVAMFIEEHIHPYVKKFSLKRILRSHKGIPEDERELVKLLMSIMAELY
jgi:hypothetical protein